MTTLNMPSSQVLANIALGDNKSSVNVTRPVALSTIVFPKDTTVQFTTIAPKPTDQVTLSDRATSNAEMGRNERQSDSVVKENAGAPP